MPWRSASEDKICEEGKSDATLTDWDCHGGNQPGLQKLHKENTDVGFAPKCPVFGVHIFVKVKDLIYFWDVNCESCPILASSESQINYGTVVYLSEPQLWQLVQNWYQCVWLGLSGLAKVGGAWNRNAGVKLVTCSLLGNLTSNHRSRTLSPDKKTLKPVTNSHLGKTQRSSETDKAPSFTEFNSMSRSWKYEYSVSKVQSSKSIFKKNCPRPHHSCKAAQGA